MLIRLCIVFLIFSTCNFVLAKTNHIKSSDAINYVGYVKEICGKVVNTKYAKKSRGKPTFLNLDKPYPNHIFTVLIWEEDRDNFQFKPESFYKNKNICVLGLISEYKGKAQIITKNEEQITVQ